MRTCLTILALVATLLVNALPIKVRIIIDSSPVISNADTIFLAGNINGWRPGSPEFMLQRTGNGWTFEHNATTEGVINFKFTRGSWDKVECTADGKDISDRSIRVKGDTVIHFSIAGWKDRFAKLPKKHTASPQVHLMDSAFHLTNLGRNRRVWIYLPKDYQTSRKRYPVLYMHDGQNLFDEAVAGFGEWGVDEWMDRLADSAKKSCIIVGIDHGGTKRINEYDPYDAAGFGKGEGKAYVNDLVQVLKPFVDKHYRTLTGKKDTWIAGSSMGGLISLWAVMAYPETYGKAGIFSPAFWIAPQFSVDIPKMMKGYKGQLFFYCGGSESKTMVSDMDSVVTTVGKVTSPKYLYKVVTPDASHNEAAWHRSFPYFMDVLFNKR